MRQRGRSGLFVILGFWVLMMRATPAAAECGYGYSGQSCVEFPIVTHWMVSGGVGQFNLAGTDADSSRVTPPTYQNYSGEITDTYGPSGQEVLHFINAVDHAPYPDETPGVPVMLYNYDSYTAFNKLVPGLGKLQVLHNVLIQDPAMTTLFTFIFPPNWQPSGSYPLLLSGNAGLTSNNAMFFLQEQTTAIANGVAVSTQPPLTGLIAALSNSGGRESAG